MIELSNGETYTFTSTNNTQVQNTSNFDVKFHTDNSAEVWGVLKPFQILEVPEDLTVYLKSSSNVKLATIEF